MGLTSTTANPRQSTSTSAHAWTAVVAMFAALMILCGGISIPSPWMVWSQSLLSLLILSGAIFRLIKYGFPTSLSTVGALIVIAAVAMVLLQLAPLPTSLWQAFPGRELIERNHSLLGVTPGWLPLSMTPEKTVANGIAMLPGIAAYLAVLTLATRQVIWVCGCIILCAIVSVGFSLAQHFQGAESLFYLYDSAGGIGVGTFNNRSFFAAQLYSSIPILSAFAVAAQSRWKLRAILAAAAAIVYAGIILVGLSLSGSRTGILFAMPAIVFAIVLGYSRSGGTQRVSRGMLGLLALLGGLLVIGQASMVGLLRLVQSDPLSDYRTVISENSLVLALKMFPAGGGFGSFVPLYQLNETPETMKAEYVNHAHNDWLELVVEGGAPALALLALFVVWLLMAVFRVWRYGQGSQTALFQRMASLVLPLLLLHSFVDFPLRTPALMTVFALCCGFLVLQPEVQRTHHAKSPKKPMAVHPAERRAPKPFRRPESGFGSSDRNAGMRVNESHDE